MSTFEKELRKLLQNPQNVRFQTLETILLNAGFEKRSKGKHNVFTCKEYILTIPAHGRNSILKSAYVKQACKCLLDMGVFDEDQKE